MKLAPLTATLAAAILTAGVLIPAPAQAARKAALNITPGHGEYAGGSALTLVGNLGVPGRRRIIVQRHMNRPGDGWGDIPGVAGWSNPDGSFRISAPASAMWGLSYRVKANGAASPGQMTYTRAQEVILDQGTTSSVGNAFRLDVDTVAAQYTGYRDLPAPTLPGRGVTLQRRVNGTQWVTVDSTTTGSNGQARFTLTADQVGTETYRARLDDWTQNGDRLGWTTSFPIDVRTYASPRAAVEAGLAPSVSTAVDPLPAPTLAAASGIRRHAGATYKWGTPRLSYDWEYGESLDSPPAKGVAPAARWSEKSEGTGRATLRNGGLLFSSDGYGSAPQGARGDIWTTLDGGGAFRRGRWETRGSTTQRSNTGAAYRMRYELIPVTQAGERCPSSGIVIAETTGPGGTVKYGVRGPKGGSFVGTTRLSGTPGASSFAVQVTKQHITWFLNGQPIGTVRDRSMLPTQRMTVRLSLVAEGDSRMKSTKSTVDWVRSYSMKRGAKPTSRNILTNGGSLSGC